MTGRLVRDPEVKYTQGSKPMCVAKYTLAVNRKYKQQDGQNADFINCIAFGKNGEFTEKYLKQGIKISVCGRIQTTNYTRKDGTKVYNTDVVVEEQEFAESKAANESASSHTQEPQYKQQTLPEEPEPPKEPAPEQPWMKIPDDYGSELPFV